MGLKRYTHTFTEESVASPTLRLPQAVALAFQDRPCLRKAAESLVSSSLVCSTSKGEFYIFMNVIGHAGSVFCLMSTHSVASSKLSEETANWAVMV